MKWYKKLSIHQKINVKHMCIDITGVDFRAFVLLGFSFSNIMDIIYKKLVEVGFDI